MRLLVLYGPILVLLLVIALTFIRALARKRAADAGTSPAAWLAALSPIPLLISVVSLAAGIFLFSNVSASLAGYFAARTWVATPCTILASTVETQKNRSGKVSSRLSLRYAYEVTGRRLEGNRYEFGWDGFSGGDRAQRIAATLQPGTPATCYVDPGRPDRAVVSRAFSQELLLFAIGGLIFAGAGAGILVSSVRQARARVREAEGV